MITYDTKAWAEEIFASSHLGDVRRERRLVEYAARQAQDPSKAINALYGDDDAAREGTYRWLQNDYFTTQEVAEAGFESTAREAKHYELMLDISDTTTLSYSHSVAKELGLLGGPKGHKNRGWYVHSSLLIDARNGVPIGLIDQERWLRRKKGQRAKRKERPYEEKESFKWERADRRVGERLGENMARVISVTDRESDVYEYLSFKIERKERFIVRASWNRKVLKSEHGKLWATLKRQPSLGEVDVEVPQRGGREARLATLTVRSGEMTLNPPRRPHKKLKPLKVNAVYAVEENPPPGEKALEWLLFTSEEVESFEAAVLVLGYYKKRWTIEDWHKAWKSGGCEVEERRAQEAETLEREAVVLAFIAVRLLQLKTLSEVDPKASCELVLEEDRWRCLWLSVEEAELPKEAPNVQWAFEALARLGGWNRKKKSQWRPGLKVLWQGWRELESRFAGWQLAQTGKTPPGEVLL